VEDENKAEEEKDELDVEVPAPFVEVLEGSEVVDVAGVVELELSAAVDEAALDVTEPEEEEEREESDELDISILINFVKKGTKGTQ
jgi:hypothetical protein